MGRWIRRSLLCIALGFVTAWLVAWGLTVAMWAGWYPSPATWVGEGIGVVEPWLLKKQVHRRSGQETETWHGDRLDRAYPASDLRRRDADRVLEIGGEAFAEEQERDLIDFLPQMEAMLNEQPGSMTEQYTDAKASLPRFQRIDHQVALPLPSEVAGRMTAAQAESLLIFINRVGWPMQMLSGMDGVEFTWSASAAQRSDVDGDVIKIQAIKRNPGFGQPPEALALPIGVIAPAAIANTLFYAIAWFALFIGFELARSLRRHMAGRCVRCGYDLRRVAGKTCPECGRTKK